MKAIGVKPFTWKQRFKIYWLLVLWTLFFIYLIVANAICDCLFLISGEGVLMFLSFVLSATLTASWWKRQHRKNWIYED